MFDYWYRRGLVQVIEVDDDTKYSQTTLFASTSTPEEWKTQGNYFKKKRLWEPAMKCYQKAQCMHLAVEAHAYSLVQQARRSTNPNEAENTYLHAAKCFLECNEIEHNFKYLENAAKCLMSAKKYKDAAELFISLGKVWKL